MQEENYVCTAVNKIHETVQRFVRDRSYFTPKSKERNTENKNIHDVLFKLVKLHLIALMEPCMCGHIFYLDLLEKQNNHTKDQIHTYMDFLYTRQYFFLVFNHHFIFA